MAANEDEIVKAQYGLEKRKLRTLHEEVPLFDSEAHLNRWRNAEGDEMLDQPISIRRMVFKRLTAQKPWEYIGTEDAM